MDLVLVLALALCLQHGIKLTMNLESLSRLRIYPFSIDVSLLLEQ